jgi:hypothetical protein
MPHSLDERAPSLAARRILQSEEIKDFLKTGVMQGNNGHPDPLTPTRVPDGGRLPTFVLAIDGSLQPVPVQHGFPGAEVAYFSFASVLLNMDLVADLEAKRPVSPSAFKHVRMTTPHVMVLPGRNFRQAEDISPRACFRRLSHSCLGAAGMQEGAETLLETYETLLQHRSDTGEDSPKCPYPSCDRPKNMTLPKAGVSSCPCSNKPLYPTDWLRIHEGFNDIGENGAAYMEFMQVAERLWLVNVLRTLKKTNLLSRVGRLALVMDGPLAVFGHPAWLKDAIKAELQELNREVRKQTGQDILLIGIEKTGQFVDHFLALDRDARGTPNQIPNSTLFLLGGNYIKRNIIMSESDRDYGYQTYFGRKFFYKTKTGAMIVASLPFLREGDDDLDRAELDQFPRIGDALFLLDHLVSSQFPNATVPLVEAHAQAAIARGLNGRILEKLTQELAGSGNGR